MTQLRVEKVGKYYDGLPVFTGISLAVGRGDRLGIVGPNGAGKSTLLRIMAGQLHPDEGTVATLGERVSRAMMSQEADFDPERTVFGSVMEAFDDLQRLESSLRRMEMDIARAEEGVERSRLLENYGRVMTAFEDAGGYGIEARAREILGGLGFPEEVLERPVGTFSGGEQVRLALAQALLAEPDILMLDEPTNHLDLESSEWLEEFLRGYAGAVVVVSHDRYFLDRVARSILEIHGGRAEIYNGNYTDYMAQREARHELQMKRYRRQQEEIERLEDFVRRYGAGQRAREAQDRQKKIDRIERIEPPPDSPDGMGLVLRAPRSGHEVLRTRGLRIVKGEHTLVRDLDLDLYRGQRIALLGPNGAGKTSLLRVLVGEEAPAAGDVSYGVGVSAGYFPQDLAFPDEELSVVDELRRGFPGMVISEVRNYLARFGFTGEEVFDPVHTLSGGERTRLHLARLALLEATLLVLDEPTNHLDLGARESLEDALEAFDGTVIFVTHDRYFVDRLATELWVLKDAEIEGYLGGYSEYRRRMAAAVARDKAARNESPGSGRGRRRDRSTTPSRPKRSRAQPEDLSSLEARIAALEAEREELAAALGDPDSYQEGGGAKPVARYRELESELVDLYDRWEEVGRILEERDEL